MDDARGTERIQTVIVGGGQAGLAVGYHLARRNMPLVILDASGLRRARVKSDGPHPVYSSPTTEGLTFVELLRTISKVVEGENVQRIALDPVTSLMLRYSEELKRRRATIAFFDTLGDSGCTSLVTSELKTSLMDRRFQLEEFLSHGVVLLHTLMHAFPGAPTPPAHVLAHINRHLLAVAPEGMFATAFYGVYDAPHRRLRYSSAGHPPPRWRSGSGCIRDVELTTGLPLGVLDEDSWAERELSLIPGDALLLYTDGILEGNNTLGESFGRPRLDDALRLGPARAGALVQHIERHYKAFCNGAPDMDDRTLLAAVAVP